MTDCGALLQGAGSRMTNEPFLASLRSIVGPTGVVTDSENLDRYTREWRGKYLSGAIAAVRPASTGEVSDVIKACVQHGISITPQGGNTGLVGGSVPIVTRPRNRPLARPHECR